MVRAVLAVGVAVLLAGCQNNQDVAMSSPCHDRLTVGFGGEVHPSGPTEAPNYDYTTFIEGFAATLTGCQDYKDVVVTNPCRDRVSVRFGGEGHPSGMTGATRIAPASTARIHDVLAKPNYDYMTFIEYVFDDSPKDGGSNTIWPHGDPTSFRIERRWCPEWHWSPSWSPSRP